MGVSFVISLVFGLYLIFAEGTEGVNDYGDRPSLQ